MRSSEPRQIDAMRCEPRERTIKWTGLFGLPAVRLGVVRYRSACLERLQSLPSGTILKDDLVLVYSYYYQSFLALIGAERQ
jgi:hypothetical protein